MNSLTSRPRSPIRPITLTSGSACRAIIPNRVLLPTPLPAITPRRWPLPQVRKASMALIPEAIFSLIRGRLRGGGGSWLTR